MSSPKVDDTAAHGLAAAFPREPEATGLTWRRALAYAAAITVACAAVVLRQPGLSALDTVWAEDGSIFLSDAVGRPFRDVVLAPYAGYIHLVPRLLAEVASHLPLEMAAIVISGGSALVLALLAAFVYRATSRLERTPVRFALASAVILLPIAIREVLNNATNLHWFFIFAAFWALLWVPSRWPNRALACVIVALAALSDPLTLLLAPVALARVAAVRRLGDHLVTVTWGVALAVQGVVIAGAGPQEIMGADLTDLGSVFGTRVIAVNLLGVQLVERLWPILDWFLPIAGVLIGAAFIEYCFHRPNLSKALVALTVTVGVLAFVVPLYIRWSSGMLDGSPWGLGGTRYVTVPTLVLLSLVALVLDRRDLRVTERRWAGLVRVALVWSVAVVGMSISMPNAREAGPSWQESIGDARAACADPAVPSVNVPLPIGWSVFLPCEIVRGDSPLRR